MACKTCENRLKELMQLEYRLAEERKHTELFRKCLEAAQAEPSVESLLKTASTAIQVAKLSSIASVVEEASAVALAALKQVRERLGEGAKDDA